MDQQLKTGKARGIDGIAVEMLKAGERDVISFLPRMYDTLFS